MKVFCDKAVKTAHFCYTKHFALTCQGRTHPFTTLEGRFSLLFAQSLYYGKLAFCAKIHPFRPYGKIRTANFRGYAWQNAILPRFIIM